MLRITTYAGIAASLILIAFGIGALVMGIDGRSTVRDNLKREQIVGTPDMSPSAIKAEIAKAGLKNVGVPGSSVAGASINTPGEARTFSEYMRIHALLATGGQVYAQMGRYLDTAGKPTSDEGQAAIDPKTKKPVENGARNLWVTETALSTALNTTFFADRVALFSLIIGVALLLTGVGFGVMTVRVLLGRKEQDEVETARASAPAYADAGAGRPR
jgi:hypothetical protein